MISCLARLVTMDETWIYHYDPETKQKSMGWRHSGSTRPQKFRVQKYAGKVLVSISWNQHGILLIDYLPKGHTINAEYYSSLLMQLRIFWRKNSAGSSPRRSCSCTTMPRLTGHCNPEEIGLPGLPVSWSPTLFSVSGPVGLPPVPWTEKTVESSPFFVWRGGHYCRGDLVGRTTFWIFLSGLQKLEQWAKNCIELRGVYVE